MVRPFYIISSSETCCSLVTRLSVTSVAILYSLLCLCFDQFAHKKEEGHTMCDSAQVTFTTKRLFQLCMHTGAPLLPEGRILRARMELIAWS